MRIIRVFFVLSLFAAAAFQANAQRLTTVNVHIPYTVLIGEQRLSPGDYTIQSVVGYQNLFAVYSGPIFEAFVKAIPMEIAHPSANTQLAVRTDGRDYVLDQMQIEGMDTAYQFFSPESVKSRQHERAAAGK